MQLKDLVTHANGLGVSVMYTRLPGNMLGAYAIDLDWIFIDSRLTPNEQVVTLAHECGHARFGHTCERGVRSNPAHERQADRYAADLLIDHAEFERLEAISGERHFLADELGVTVDFINWYCDNHLTKLTGVTYAGAREGVDQWAYRSVYA